MFDLVLACFIGIGIGTCTGMVPGIHVNTAGAIMFASSTFLLNYISAEFLCVIFVAMSIAHALIEFVYKLYTIERDLLQIIILVILFSYKKICFCKFFKNC